MSRWQVDSGIILNTPFSATNLTLPKSLDIHSTLAYPAFRAWSNNTVEDVIVLAEFSEIEGPVPLLTIPQIPNPHLDLNDFVVKILSTDYLNTSGEFRVYEDTQLVQQDLSCGIHVYVHYFTLYDVRARGFVRPMCLSYISQDFRKLTRYFSELRQHFILATQYLKLSNFEWFSKEMVGLMRNLEYTKDRYILAQRNAAIAKKNTPVSGFSSPDNQRKGSQDTTTTADTTTTTNTTTTAFESSSASVIMTIQINEQSQRSTLDGDNGKAGEIDGYSDGGDGKGRENDGDNDDSDDDDDGIEDDWTLLRHTSLESMATQLLECQHILNVLKPHMAKKEIEEELNILSNEINSKSNSPLYKTMTQLNMFTKPKELKPSICVLSLMRRHFNNMRSIQQLCSVGYVASLYKLKCIYDRYCKSLSTLMFEDLDTNIYQNPFSSLFIGNIPVIQIQKTQQNTAKKGHIQTSASHPVKQGQKNEKVPEKNPKNRPIQTSASPQVIQAQKNEKSPEKSSKQSASQSTAPLSIKQGQKTEKSPQDSPKNSPKKIPSQSSAPSSVNQGAKTENSPKKYPMQSSASPPVKKDPKNEKSYQKSPKNSLKKISIQTTAPKTEKIPPKSPKNSPKKIPIQTTAPKSEKSPPKSPKKSPKNISSPKKVPPLKSPSPYSALCYDLDFIRLLKYGLSNLSSPNEEDIEEIQLNLSTVSSAADCLKVFTWEEEEEEEVIKEEEEENKKRGEVIKEEEEEDKKRGEEEEVEVIKKEEENEEENKKEEGKNREKEENKKREEVIKEENEVEEENKKREEVIKEEEEENKKRGKEENEVEVIKKEEEKEEENKRREEEEEGKNREGEEKEGMIEMENRNEVKETRENKEEYKETVIDKDIPDKSVKFMEKNTERNPERNTQKYTERNAEKYPERNRERNTEINTEKNAERNPEKYPEKNTEENAERNPERNAEIFSDEETITENSGSTPDSLKVDLSPIYNSGSIDLSVYEDIQEEEGVDDEVRAVVQPNIVHRLTTDDRMIISKVCRLSGLVQQFCGVSHCLFHALLSGRPVILAAAENYKSMVTLYVSALSTLIPHIPTTQLPTRKWHTGTITEHHLRQYKVMGVCIPERLHVQDLMSNATLNQVTVLNIETGHISGVAYSGNLVGGIEQYGRKLFHSNSALQACVQSILVSLGLKVYLLYHLLETTHRSATDILKGIGVVKGDWQIIIYLADIVKRQTLSMEK